MSKLEKLLTYTLSQFNEKEITLRKAKELFNKAKRSLWDADDVPGSPVFNNRFTKESVELAFEVLFKFAKVADEFIEKWQKGKVSFTVEELVLLSKAGDEVTEFLAYFQGRYFQIKHSLVCMHNVDKYSQIIKSVQNIRDFEEIYIRQVCQGSSLSLASVEPKANPPLFLEKAHRNNFASYWFNYTGGRKFLDRLLFCEKA